MPAIDENKPFIITIKELPDVVKSIGYDAVEPRLINSRTGVFLTLIAMLRLPEVHINNDALIFVTAKIGKELLIDPYELLTPQDYRTSSGTRKLEYRTIADMRAYAMINKLINDCKGLNREIINLSHQEDLPRKVEHLCNEATLTFKRIVSLKEFSFGGAYLLDEDIYEHIQNFSNDIEHFSMLSTSSTLFRELMTLFSDEGKQCGTAQKLEKLTNDAMKEYFIPTHEKAVSLVSQTVKDLESKAKFTGTIKESITFTKEFVDHITNSKTSDFDATVFRTISVSLDSIIQAYEQDLAALIESFKETFASYLSNVPPAISERGNFNPNHIPKIAKKQHLLVEKFISDLDRFIIFNSTNEFRRTTVTITAFYNSLNAKYLENNSFRDSVGRSFKFKKMIKR